MFDNLIRLHSPEGKRAEKAEGGIEHHLTEGYHSRPSESKAADSSPWFQKPRELPTWRRGWRSALGLPASRLRSWTAKEMSRTLNRAGGHGHCLAP